MQDAARNFLRHIRSTIEAAERGHITAQELAEGRNSMNELLEFDWVMPRVVSEVSMHWKVLEESLRAILEGQASGSASSEDVDAAWAAYHDIESVLEERE